MHGLKELVVVMHGGLHHGPLGISQSKTAGGNVDATICDQQCKKVRTVRVVEGAETVVRSTCFVRLSAQPYAVNHMACRFGSGDETSRLK